MEWLYNLFGESSVTQQVAIISLTCACGLMLGKIKIKGVGLGASGALFAGIIFSYIGFNVKGEVLQFIQEFGLILFVYTIGMQVGPGFVDSIRRNGIVLNVISTIVIVLGLLSTICIYFLTPLKNNVALLVGMLCGSVTNTPSLGAATSALSTLNANTELTGIGYAVAYPFGVIGAILAMLFIRIIFKQKPEKCAQEYKAEVERNASKIESCTLILQNANLNGTTIKEIPDIDKSSVVFTRIMHDNIIAATNANTKIYVGDFLHAVGTPEDILTMQKIIGSKRSVPITTENSELATKTILVTNKKMLGKTIGSLSFDERYSVTISRLTRGEFKFTGTHDLRLKFADKLLVVGPKENIKIVEKELGNSLTALERPEILPAFLGIFLGVLIGSVPIPVPGMPFSLKLGLAGGPLIVAIILSRKRKLGPLNFFMSTSANLMLREFGIAIFLSCVGLNAGAKFFDILLNGAGFYYMSLAAIITFLPLIIAGFIGKKLNINYLTLTGALAGSMTSPPALSFANAQADSNATNVGYAAVYPLTMLLRIISAQALAILLYSFGS